jgi:uncharacterized protein YifN (PemK superfamily)
LVLRVTSRIINYFFSDELAWAMVELIKPASRSRLSKIYSK